MEDLSISDEELSLKDQKNQEKNLARLKKIKDSKSAVEKPVSAYEAECKEILDKLEAKRKPKVEEKPNPYIYNKPKPPEPKDYLGGLEVKKLVKKSFQRKKIEEDINHNHIEREKRFQALQEEYCASSNYISRSARKKARKKKEKKPSKPAGKNIDSWKSYTQFPKPCSNQVTLSNSSIPPPHPGPFNLTSSQYQISLKLFLR